MKPYVYERPSGARLRVDPDGGMAMLKAAGKNGGESWVPVDALDIPEVTNAMWRACGQEPPVMLGRPDLGLDLIHWPMEYKFRELAVRRSADGGVTFGIGGNSETLPPSQVRQMAAIAVALADEPDPHLADVESLASYLAEAGFGPGATPETVAVAALRWMRNREARDGDS